jgi:alkylhydroperoxidase/carboxymuconolactone decarboxylase family protein YurZ
LSPRDINLLNIAVAAVRNRTGELRAQLMLALTNDVTPEEIADILDQAALRAGHLADDRIAILGDVLRDTDGL